MHCKTTVKYLTNKYGTILSLKDPGTEPRSPALQADSLPTKPLGKPHIMGFPEQKHAHILLRFHLWEKCVFFVNPHAEIIKEAHI